MALRLLSPGRRAAVLYSRTLRQISAGLRGLATKDDVGHYDESVIEVRLGPSSASDLLGDTDRRLPLPGGVGLAEELSPPPPPAPARPPRRPRNEAAAAELYQDRHLAALASLLSPAPRGDQEPADAPPPPAAPVLLEIQAHECPQLLKEEFRSLFRERDIAAGRLTVLVVSQRTDGDMGTWSEEIEAERAELTTHFLSVGRDIVLGLRRLGHWADLVDPRSGRPDIGALCPADADTDADRLVETDDRLGRLGFQIDDLGCCKVIRHAVWGSHVFVGCMFTDAAVDDPGLSRVIAQYQELPAAPPA